MPDVTQQASWQGLSRKKKGLTGQPPVIAGGRQILVPSIGLRHS